MVSISSIRIERREFSNKCVKSAVIGVIFGVCMNTVGLRDRRGNRTVLSVVRRRCAKPYAKHAKSSKYL